MNKKNGIKILTHFYFEKEDASKKKRLARKITASHHEKM